MLVIVSIGLVLRGSDYVGRNGSIMEFPTKGDRWEGEAEILEMLFEYCDFSMLGVWGGVLSGDGGS